jgi:multiple sugar transport system permease protein
MASIASARRALSLGENRAAILQRKLGRTSLYFLVVILMLIFAFPLYYMSITSLMTQFEAYLFPPLLYPKSWLLGNYAEMFSVVPLARWFRNTVMVAFFQVAGATLSSVFVGYGFARFEFPGRELLFMITLGTMMVPSQITLIPQFVLFHRLRWVNTFYPLIVPAFFGGGAFNIFLMRQFIMQLPRELDEAALIDGANPLRIFFSVLLPLIKPVVATVAIIRFMASWNDFMGPLIYLQSNKFFTLAVGLRYWDVQPSEGEFPQTNLMMAMCVVTTLPCIILFFSAQRVFVRGIAMTGIKG